MFLTPLIPCFSAERVDKGLILTSNWAEATHSFHICHQQVCDTNDFQTLRTGAGSDPVTWRLKAPNPITEPQKYQVSFA